MARQLPSLNGLRAFEAAARHGSFKSAAEELSVTQAAVSHMVRQLEAQLGFKLFRRMANRLEPTEQGRVFQPGLTKAFDRIAELSKQVASMQPRMVVTAGVAPALALHWLIPRLTSFSRSHPEIDVRLATAGETRPIRDDWTCVIKRGLGDWPGYTCEELFPTTLVLVCAPQLAATLVNPGDLQHQPTIVVSHLRDQWNWWFERAGAGAPPQPLNQVSVESSVMALQAVLDGVGVTVTQLSYVTDALAAGRLVAPFTTTNQRYESWYLSYKPSDQNNQSFIAFRDWLRLHAERQREVQRSLGLGTSVLP